MKVYKRVTIGQWLTGICEKYPQRIALSYPGITFTYKEVQEQTDAYAAFLWECGIKRGSHAAIFAANTPQLTLICYALWSIGAVVIPICTAYSKEEQRHALDASDAEFIILSGDPVNGRFAFDEDDRRDLCFIDMRQDGWKRPIPDNDILWKIERCKEKVLPEDPDLILFTSGTTETAKPVISKHINRINLAETHSEALEANERDVFCAVLPLYHCFSITGVMLAAMCCGAELAFPLNRHSEHVLQCIQDRRCTILSAVPTLYSALLRKNKELHYDTGSLRTGMIGGSPYTRELFCAINDGFDFTLLPSIGQTEATAGYTSGKLTDDLTIRSTSLGMLFPEIECRITDGSGIPLPEGETGHICLKGPSIIGSYYKNQGKECIENGWMDTGDLGYMDPAGHLYYMGREKELIIRSGENISPAAIEKLFDGYPGISSVKAIGIPDPHRIEEVCLCIIAERPLPAETIKQFMTGRIAAYMIPRYIVFLDKMPIKPSGKIDLAELKKIAAERCLSGDQK